MSSQSSTRVASVAGHVLADVPAQCKLLVANRGEIACRIFRVCKILNIISVAVYTKEDSESNHALEADESYLLEGTDPVAPYLNVEKVIEVCKSANVHAVHPGYGFLSENPAFATALAVAGVLFIGPRPDVLETFGDKTASRKFAEEVAKVSVARGSPVLKDAKEGLAFVKEKKMTLPLLLKAANGGGGKGQRIVRKLETFEQDWQKCAQEAEMAFGKGEIFVEEYIENARHIEVQVICDSVGNCLHAFERDCSLQLRNQKVLEIAPARGISASLRKELTSAALRLCRGIGYMNAGTVEFLVQGEDLATANRYIFLEVNPRIQVEHTITEELTRLDLIQAQIRVAFGESLETALFKHAEVKNQPSTFITPASVKRMLASSTLTTKTALKERQNTTVAKKFSDKLQEERMVCGNDGNNAAAQLRINLLPGAVAKTFSVYQPPPNVRVDTGIREGGPIVTHYDSMLAKLIVTGKNEKTLVENCLAALDNFKIEGASVNLDQHRKILNHPDFLANRVFTTSLAGILGGKKGGGSAGGSGKSESTSSSRKELGREQKSIGSPLPGQVVEMVVKEGDVVEEGQTLCVISAMKLLNDVPAPHSGKITKVLVKKGQTVVADDGLFEMEAIIYEEEAKKGSSSSTRNAKNIKAGSSEGASSSSSTSCPHQGADPLGAFRTVSSSDRATGKTEQAEYVDDFSSPALGTKIKPDSDQFKKRQKVNQGRIKLLEDRIGEVLQYGGEKMIARNRKRGKYLARERIQKVCDPGTRFLELSQLACFDMYEGKAHSASVICGIGIVHGRETMFIANDSTINGGAFYPETSKKVNRAQDIAEKNHLPCIYFVDGGGANLNASMDSSKSGTAPSTAFVWGGLQFKNQAVMSSKRIPQIGVAFGTSTAGAAYTCAMCDELVMVKKNGLIFLGGAPLVQAATGEVADEQELGGAAMHTSKSGVADHFAETEDEALAKVRTIVEHLSLRRKLPVLNMGIQGGGIAGQVIDGALGMMSTSSPRLLPVQAPLYPSDDLLGIIPEDNKLPFEVREVIARLVDGSRWNEFKPRYGATLVCGFAHIHGYPVAILANNGMLFSESAIKATHFIQIAGQRGLPLLFLQNISGFIIGTQYEQQGITKDGAKMVTAVSCYQFPKLCVVLGGAHGAGNYAMGGPAFDPRFIFLWPNAKISVMGGAEAAKVIIQVQNNAMKRKGQPGLPEEMKQMLIEKIVPAIDDTATAYHHTAQVYDDGILDPRDTRDVLGMCLQIIENNAPVVGGPSYGVFRN
ncbi:unnamed protein product [Amoebophrya sp. A25]|nr:unnamed protein product [Amoebophrya sp. A25]|eukprot:GSA25T00012337001.1